MNIFVCIGSSCHLRGSYAVIEQLKELIAANGLEDKVELSGSFCLGECTQSGVSVRFGNSVVCGVTPENLREVFAERVLNAI